jgi:hypothetical protein
MPELLFDPTCWSNKRSSTKLYEENICTQIVKSSRRRANNQISYQQTQDILNNNLKISADGTIATHNDIAIMTPQIGDVFTFADDAWVNMPWTDYTPITTQQSSNITTNLTKISADGPINTHSDVQTVNNMTGEILHWGGTNWVNTTKTFITEQQALDITTANAKVSAAATINTHSDVETVNNMTGQVLMFDGSIWKESTLPPLIN